MGKRTRSFDGRVTKAMIKPLARNALANVLQTISGAALLFALYRYINTTLGVEQLGVWSVVLATVSASRLADMGLSGGVVRFVARDRARGELDRAGKVVDTAALSLMVTIGAILPLVYPLLGKLLPHLFEGSYLAQALAILPYALVSLWLTVVAAVFQGGLDGCQRMDLRAGLVVSGQALLLALAFWLVPQHGLLGLAWAQIGQGLFLAVIGRFLLRNALPTLTRLPRRWRKHVLREMLGYGANLQAATLFMLLVDPVANALMARFGGPAAAGYFAMANQVVLKARSVIVTANQAVVPYIATLAEGETGRLDGLYRNNMRVLVFVTIPAFALLFAWAGVFSWLLTGGYQAEFVFFLGLVCLAWCVNTFTGPAYFMNMGTGRVGWNTLAHLMMGTLNVSLGLLLGSFYGAHGVLYAYTIAVITASGVLIVAFQHQNRLNWRDAFSREHLGLMVASVVVVAFTWTAALQITSGTPIGTAIGLVLPPFLLGLAIIYHPMRGQFLSWLTARVPRT